MNTFSERKALYHTNVDVAFDLQSHQILLSAANIKTSTDTSFNFENFEEKQIL